ncbi:unknown [Prevotella sp. CAG:755]|nr:unknown [Prevotella sp. CAG:755]
MKKVLLISMMLLVTFTVRAQTKLFTYNSSTGDVVPNAKFIDPIEPVTWPTTWVDEATQTVYSSDKTYRYDIRLHKQAEAEGMKLFEAMEIKCAGKTILNLNSQEAWACDYPLSDGVAAGYFTVKHLDVHVTALVLLGWCYNTDVPWITIIILNRDMATVVFHRRGDIRQCTTDTPYGLNMVYADKIQGVDENDNPTPPDSELRKFRIWQEGQYLRFTQTQ